MVLKLVHFFSCVIVQFENDVEMYGAQTNYVRSSQECLFENDVEMYGAQTFL